MLQKIWDRSLLDVLGWCRPYALATIWRMPPARCCHCLSTGCSCSQILSPLPGKGVSKRQAGRGLAATLPLWVPRRPLAAICCKMIPEAELRKAMVRVGLQTGPRLQSLLFPRPGGDGKTSLGPSHATVKLARSFQDSSWPGVGSPGARNVTKCPDPRGRDQGRSISMMQWHETTFVVKQ